MFGRIIFIKMIMGLLFFPSTTYTQKADCNQAFSNCQREVEKQYEHENNRCVMEVMEYMDPFCLAKGDYRTKSTKYYECMQRAV